jgi:hypothetical protein
MRLASQIPRPPATAASVAKSKAFRQPIGSARLDALGVLCQSGGIVSPPQSTGDLSIRAAQDGYMVYREVQA